MRKWYNTIYAPAGMRYKMDINQLNENQKEAVLADDRYLRIIAGAGSGKTRVLTMRIVHLIRDLDVYPYHILAITFTNKAANEMKERVRNMLGDDTSVPWISTIHSLCVRILRQDIHCMGWPKNFTVLDADDQKAILKEAYKELRLDAASMPYGGMLNYISANKTEDVSVDEAMRLAGNDREDVLRAKVYAYYRSRQEELFALDFDDLIIETTKLFASFSEVLKKWQRRFGYILVDEFQDIDRIQYRLIRQLAGEDNSVYVVGDPDQTIYTWRGADVNIIMNFRTDFPDVRTIILNENYRSTDMILNGANSVIRHNRNRVEKELFTNRKSEEKITHYAAGSDEAEAQWIAAKIAAMHRAGKPYKDIAVLYRSNYLSRSLEKGMIEMRIPYIIYGGLRLYERKEIKDALCYLRMAVTSDDLALQRILNEPKRGIGNKTMDTIAEKAREKHCTMYEVLRDEKLFAARTQNTLDKFAAMVEGWKKQIAAGNVDLPALFEQIIEDSGYKAMLEEKKETERIENLKELIDDVREFQENEPDSSLDEYLQQVSLYGDREETMESDYVQLMTVHAAKGLEFDTVFISDMNDGIFPNERAMNEGKRGVEEERRLAYVAFTRARNKLFITEAGGFSYILQKVRMTSRFVREIDEACIEHAGAAEKKDSGLMTFSPNHGSDIGGTQLKKRSSLLSKGDIVVHKVFGEGVVLQLDGQIASIAFPYPHGVKKIAAGHPALQKK